METAHIKFNGGIWSESLQGRYDLDSYSSAARTCENFIPTRYGQVEKRSGTKYIGAAKYSDKICVLHPFQFSVNTTFILEFGELYVRFWSNDLQVEVNPSNWATSKAYTVGAKREDGGKGYVCLVDHTSGTFATDLGLGYWYELEASETANFYKLEFPTPYLESELYELQIRAVNDVLYIVHPNHPVGKLTRLTDNKWTYQVAELDLPFVDPDVDPTDVKLTPSATTGNITITASGSVFDASYVGSELRLEYLEEGTSTSFYDEYITNPDIFDSDTYNANDDIVTYSTTAASGTYSPDNSVGKTRVRYDVGQQFDCYSVIRDFTFLAWGTNAYAVDDLVEESGLEYICLEAHTGAVFATDLAAGKWREVTKPSDAPAYFSKGVLVMEATAVSGAWSLKTAGNWTGEWWIQRSKDGGSNWSTIKVLTSVQDSNYLVEEDEEGTEVLIRVLGAGYNDGGLQRQSVTFSSLATPVYGRAEVTAYNSAKSVDATVIDDMPETTDSVAWKESGFSPRQGYPRAIALFDSRVVLAGTAKKPQGFFYSAIGLYEDFTATTTLADAPFFIEALSEDQSSIQWISAQKELFVGTASVEGTLIARKNDEAQSAENPPTVKWNESMGSAHRPAMSLNDSLACLQRGQTSINILSYSLDRDGYTGEEVTLLCPHLFDSRIQQLSHAREPYSGMYAVIGDGTLCHMVYEPRLQVTGWCKYTTKDGAFESVAILPEDGGNEDHVWCSVKRTVNGSAVRYIERFTTGNRKLQRDKDLANCWHLDSGKKYTGSPVSNTLTGLDHLEGEEVIVLIDGQTETHTVASGSVTTTLSGDVVIVGLIVCSYFEPLDVEMQGTPSKRRQHFHSKLLINNSFGGEVGNEGEDYTPIIYHKAGEPMNEITLGNGYYEIFHESSHARQKYWSIKHEDPFPFTLQAVMQTVKVNKK